MFMNNITIKKFKLFWAWQDECEETWLGEMSQQGLHLKALGFPGWYLFLQAERRDYVYRLDFITSNKNKAEYLQFFADAGWEYLGQMGGWQYFRKERQGLETPEIYTDNDSKVQKYGRLIGFLVIFLPILIVNFNNIVERDASLFKSILLPTYLILLGIYTYAMINLIRRVSKLKKRL